MLYDVIPMAAPDGKYLYWYNAIDTTWNTYNLTTDKEYTITIPATVRITSYNVCYTKLLRHSNR